MPEIKYTNSCCGAAEISGVSEYRFTNEPEFWDEFWTTSGIFQKCSIVLFSDIPRRSRGGQGLANFIKRKRYGSITQTPWVVNKQTGNKIRFWSWTPNKSFWKYFDRITA